jgi:hypothetical protein
LLKDLKSSIKQLHDINASVRFNCNCLAGHIDSKEKINNYITWAKEIGADTIRFAELKQDDKAFVNLAKILNYQYGLTDDPFVDGCHCNAIINDMPVNFRQMCGLQTTCRKKPINPNQYAKQVLYYDGKFYNGWQSQNKGETYMTDKELANLLRSVESGLLTSEEAFAKIKLDPARKVEKIKYVERDSSGYGCQY